MSKSSGAREEEVLSAKDERDHDEEGGNDPDKPEEDAEVASISIDVKAEDGKENDATDHGDDLDDKGDDHRDFPAEILILRIKVESEVERDSSEDRESNSVDEGHSEEVLNIDITDANSEAEGDRKEYDNKGRKEAVAEISMETSDLRHKEEDSEENRKVIHCAVSVHLTNTAEDERQEENAHNRDNRLYKRHHQQDE